MQHVAHRLDEPLVRRNEAVEHAADVSAGAAQRRGQVALADPPFA